MDIQKIVIQIVVQITQLLKLRVFLMN